MLFKLDMVVWEYVTKQMLHKNSKDLLLSLKAIIIRQERDLRNYDSEKVKNTIKETKCLKEAKYVGELESIKESD